MHNRVSRKLPFPPASHFTFEMIAKIKAIPDEDIRYTAAEIKWMERAVENLDYMISIESLDGIDTSAVEIRRDQIKATLRLATAPLERAEP